MASGQTRYALSDKERGWITAMMKSKGDKAAFERWVRRKKSNSSKKGDPYILVVGHYRIVTVKRTVTGAKTIAKEYHLYEVKELSCTLHQNATFVFRDGFTFQFETDKAIDAVLAYKKNLDRITVDFPSTSLPVLTLTDQYSKLLKSKEVKHNGEAGNIIPIYSAHSYHLKKWPSKSVAEHIKEKDEAGDTVLNLTEVFSIHPKGMGADVTPLMRALKHNRYFTSLQITDMQRRDALALLSVALETNNTVTDLRIVGLNDPKSGFSELAAAIKANPGIQLTCMDFSHTRITKTLGSSGAAALAEGISALPHGLVALRLTDCELNAKSSIMILTALSEAKATHGTLQVMCWSGNEIGHAKDTNKLMGALLGELRALKTLELKNTDIDLSSAVNALLKSCTSTLELLDVGGNKIGSIQLSAILSKFISLCHRLSWIGMSSCRLTGEIFEGIVASVGTNPRLQSELVMVDVSNNELGSKKADAAAVCRSVANTKNLNGLDLRESKFKTKELVSVIESFESGHVRRLELGCLKRSAAKAVMAGLVQSGALGGPDGGVLQYLTLCGDAKRQYGDLLLPLIDALATNRSLIHLDISANLIGDSGMHRLVKSLRTNASLLALVCDDNNASMDVWQELRDCLNMNNARLCHIDFPKLDIGRCTSKSKDISDRIEGLWNDIMDRLRINLEQQEQTEAYERLIRYETMGLETESLEQRGKMTMLGPVATEEEDQMYADTPDDVDSHRPGSEFPSAHSATIPVGAAAGARGGAGRGGGGGGGGGGGLAVPQQQGRPGSRISFRQNRKSVMMGQNTNVRTLLAGVQKGAGRAADDGPDSEFGDADGATSAAAQAEEYGGAGGGAAVDESGDAYDDLGCSDGAAADLAAYEDEGDDDYEGRFSDDEPGADDDDEEEQEEEGREGEGMCGASEEAGGAGEQAAPTGNEEYTNEAGEFPADEELDEEGLRKKREYEEYLRKKKEYEEYLRKKQEYDEYLRKKEEYDRQVAALQAHTGAAAAPARGSPFLAKGRSVPNVGREPVVDTAGAEESPVPAGAARGGAGGPGVRGRGTPRGRGRGTPRGRGRGMRGRGVSQSVGALQRPPSGRGGPVEVDAEPVVTTPASPGARRAPPRRRGAA